MKTVLVNARAFWFKGSDEGWRAGLMNPIVLMRNDDDAKTPNPHELRCARLCKGTLHLPLSTRICLWAFEASVTGQSKALMSKQVSRHTILPAVIIPMTETPHAIWMYLLVLYPLNEQTDQQTQQRIKVLYNSRVIRNVCLWRDAAFKNGLKYKQKYWKRAVDSKRKTRSALYWVWSSVALILHQFSYVYLSTII